MLERFKLPPPPQVRLSAWASLDADGNVIQTTADDDMAKRWQVRGARVTALYILGVKGQPPVGGGDRVS